MTINYTEILVKDLVAGYKNSDEEGVVAYGGKLNVRPKYQRNFIYTGKQRDEVIRTILKDFPLNSIYWATNAEGYEILDGQQRTISICDYVKGRFSVNFTQNLKML